eukprot:SAG25_NODE_222_length_11605_cov_6.982357_3_plen_67_part_00
MAYTQGYDDKGMAGAPPHISGEGPAKGNSTRQNSAAAGDSYAESHDRCAKKQGMGGMGGSSTSSAC